MRLDHVQLAIPRGGEDEVRRFYCDLLGWREVPKPASLAARGGLWLDAGEAQIHFGIEEPFAPARKAHPALRTAGLDALAAKFAAAGHVPTWDDLIPGTRRFYVADPFGNRLEFIEDKAA